MYCERIGLASLVEHHAKFLGGKSADYIYTHSLDDLKYLLINLHVFIKLGLKSKLESEFKVM